MADTPLAHSPTLVASRPPDSGPGERLPAGHACGDYVIDKPLGAGAMGEVYAGHHPVIGKRVAIKVLRRDAASSDAAERLVREAQAASQIDHPNVIDIFALGRLSDGRLFLVMDLVDGTSLRDALHAGSLAPERALAILGGIADALDAAHARGVIHRDLKPDNIMLAGDARVYVLDFGLAKLVASAQGDRVIAPGTLTGQGTWLGTPGYMAPEQWSADGAGAASDRYALGVIAFELLAGAPPFQATSVPAMMEQHFRAAVPSISVRGKRALPDAVDDVLRQALAKDPDARYPTARSMVEALRAALGTAVLPAREPPAPRANRRTLVPAVAGAGVLGLGVVVAVALRPGDDGERAATAEPVANAHRGEVSISLASTPDHAAVSVDGVIAGTTPLPIYLAPGRQAAVTVRKPGYTTAERTLVAGAAGAAPTSETFELAEVSRFAGVWRLANGELRALARQGDRVDVFKLDAVAGPRRFYRHYAFEAAEHGTAFASDEEVIDPRAPDDASCHLPVHVAYRYDPDRDALELARDRLEIDVVDGHCVVRKRAVETEPLSRVDDAHDAHSLVAPAGNPRPAKQRPQPKAVPKLAGPTNNAAPFDTVGKTPTSPYTDTKQAPVRNIAQGNADQANPPEANQQVLTPRQQELQPQQQAQPQRQAQPQPQAPPQAVQQKQPIKQ